MPKATKGRLTRPKSAAKDEQEKKRHKARLAATKKLPRGIREYVMDLSGNSPEPELLLENAAYILLAQQGQILKAHEEEVRLCRDQRKQAKQLRASVKNLKPSDPARIQAMALARDLEAGKPSYLKTAQVSADLTEKVRKLLDSLAMHRPSGYSAITVTVRQSAQEEAWSADEDDNIYDERTEQDDEYIRAALGALPEDEVEEAPAEENSDG